MHIAFLTCKNMHSQSPDRGMDCREHDLEFGALQSEGAARGIVFEEVVWDAPGVDWSRFEAALVGTTWDYPQKLETFFETLTYISRQTALFNPLSLMRWNLDKIYLADLAAKGVPSIPTLWADRASDETILSAFDELGTDTIVIKPRIGAGAWRQAKLGRGKALPPTKDLPPDACLIQPFLSNVAELGEVSLLYYDGIFSHGVRKVPNTGDYRVQSIYGAQEVVHEPDTQELAAAESTIAALPAAPLYARIDLVRDADQHPVLMEVELIEPYHYVEQGPGFAQPLIDALLARLG